MKESNFFMSLLIPSPSSLGRKIDVYLQPLIEELKELCNFGVCRMIVLRIGFFSCMQPCYEQLMTSRRMVTYLSGIQRGIRHVPFAWEIDRSLGS